MNYPEMKKNISKELDELFKDYKRVLQKTLVLNSKILNLYNDSLNTKYSEDFVNFVEKDERMKKFTTLTASLLYVENPTNEEIIQKLLDDVQLNMYEEQNKIRK